MKLTVNKKAFSTALSAIDKVVESRVTVPILSNVLLQAEDQLTVLGTDLDLEMRIEMPANVETPGSVTVPAGLIARLARSMPANAEGDLALELSESGHELQLIAARSHYDLQVLPADDYPLMQGPEEPGCTFTLPGNELAALLKQPAYAMSTEEARFFLNGIHLHPRETADDLDLVAVATDGIKLCRAVMPAIAGLTMEMPAVIIPRKTITHFVTMLNNANADVTVRIDSKKIEITAGSTRITSRLVDGTFPDYERVIPDENTIEVDLDVETLQDVSARIALLSTEKSGGSSTTFDLTEGQMRISTKANGHATSMGAEELDVDYAGDPCTILFGINQFQETINACASGLATLCLKDNATPAILKPHGDIETHQVTMLIYPRSF